MTQSETNPTADDVPRFDIVHKLVGVVRHPTMNRMHTVPAELINEAIDAIKALRTPPTPPPIPCVPEDVKALVERVLDYRKKNFPPTMSPVGYALLGDVSQAILALVARETALEAFITRSIELVPDFYDTWHSNARALIPQPIQKDAP